MPSHSEIELPNLAETAGQWAACDKCDKLLQPKLLLRHVEQGHYAGGLVLAADLPRL